jgi:hypothetical protein
MGVKSSKKSSKKVGKKVGKKNINKMGVQNGCPKWVSKMGVQNGCPKWVSKMGVQNGCPKCVSKKGGELSFQCRKNGKNTEKYSNSLQSFLRCVYNVIICKSVDMK